MPHEESREHASRTALEGVRRPVLVFDLDVAGIDAPGAPTRHCDVRLVRSVHNTPAEESWHADGGEVTAVLLLRALPPSRLVSCVRAATRAGGAISPERLCQLLPEAEGARPDPSQPELTDREYDVLRMLADGESTHGIAERLSYSERTVKNIVRDLLDKLGCRTRAHAVALAARQGVI
jgi:DNA-binding CsgD family transcriptional regulator